MPSVPILRQCPDLVAPYLLGPEGRRSETHERCFDLELTIAYHYQGNPTKRDHYYQKAKDLKYAKMTALDDVIAGRSIIGNPPANLSQATPNGEPEG